VLLPEAVEPLA